MAAPEPTDEPRPNRLLPVLFWVGVGLAPISALLLLLGQSNGTLRIAAVLAVLCVVLIGLSVVLGGNAETVRNDLEDSLREDLDALRGEVRGEIATATHSSQQAVGERLRALQHSVEVLRGQLEAVRGGAIPGPRMPDTAAGVPGPPEPARAAARVPDAPRAAARVPDAPRAAARVPDAPRAAARVPERGPGPAGPDQGAHAAPPAPPAGPYRSAAQHTGDVVPQPGRVPVEGVPVGGRAQVTPPGPRGAVPPPDASRPRPGSPRRTGTGPAGSSRQPIVERAEDVTGAGHRYAGAGHPEPDNGHGNWSDQPGPGHRPAAPTAGKRGVRREPERTDEQRHGRSAEAADDPADVEYWSGLRAGGRWESAPAEDQDHGLRTGDRRAATHGDGGGTEFGYEDRWAAIRDEDPPRPESSATDFGRDRHRRGDDDWQAGGVDPTDGGRVLASARRRYDDNEYGYPPDDDVPRAGGARRQSDDHW
jgi:hypothetical protein